MTGEYLILKGATGLTVPLVKGQSLTVEKTPQIKLRWESREHGNTWFYLETENSLFEILDTNNPESANFIISVLNAARKLNPSFLKGQQGVSVVADMEFDRNWGWGSSSSIIANVAEWSKTNAFELHSQVSAGSGYDVVSALADGPLMFSRNKSNYTTEEAEMSNSVTGSVYFVYQGRKQDSQKSVKGFLQKKKSYRVEINTISELSRHIANCKDPKDLGYYVKEHEQVMSGVLKQPTLRETRFADLDGEVKSLGAWGGDFAMIVWYQDQQDLMKYLTTKNIDIFFRYDEIVKQR